MIKVETIQNGFARVLVIEAYPILSYELIPTTRRLTFDIIYQNPKYQYQGLDDGPYWTFNASNGYQIISRSRMDIQTERIWLKGGATDERSIRSGTMTFSDDKSRDKAEMEFHQALLEWTKHITGEN